MSWSTALNIETLEHGVLASFKEGHHGCWGEGETLDIAIHDLIEVLREWHQIAPHIPCSCDSTFSR